MKAHQLEHSITRLNEISELILQELKAEKPCLDVLKEGFQSRKEYLSVFETIQRDQQEIEAAKKQMQTLRPLFDTFIALNDDIQRRMALLVERQEIVLDNARKQRKAQEKYTVSRTPNIAYY